MNHDKSETLLGKSPGQLHDDGELRVIAIRPTFASLGAETFDQIRESGSGNVAVLLRMVDAVEIVASLTDNPSRRLVFREHAEWLAESGERTLKSPRDHVRLESRLARVRAALSAIPSSTHNQPARV